MLHTPYSSSKEDRLRMGVFVVLALIVVSLLFFWQLEARERPPKLPEDLGGKPESSIEVEIKMPDEEKEFFEPEEKDIFEDDNEIPEYLVDDTSVYEELEDGLIDDRPPTHEMEENSMLPKAISGDSNREQGESLYGSINPTPPRPGGHRKSHGVKRPKVKIRKLDKEILPVYIALLQHNFSNYQLHQDILDSSYKIWLRNNNLIEHSGTVPILTLDDARLVYTTVLFITGDDVEYAKRNMKLRQEWEIAWNATSFSEEEQRKLALYVRNGGILFFNYGGGQGKAVDGEKRDFRKTMRTELTKIFGYEWFTIPSGHEIYKIKYSINEDYKLQGIEVYGRLAVIFSQGDLLSQKPWKFLTNVLLYATKYARLIDVEKYK